ncbi:MAG: TonB-dependent receptor domain-containing protein, partial [Gemmatimonadaceae bacterium]
TDASATASFAFTPDLSSRTTLGVQYYHNRARATAASGTQLTLGTKSVTASAQKNASEGTAESVTTGAFVEQQLGWRERLFLTAGLRADDNSAFGQNLDVTYYPKIGASFVVLDAENEPVLGVLGSLRLRAAWGASGVAPGTTDALRFFSSANASVLGVDQPGVIIGAIGNVELKPERSQEVEAGLDAGLVGGRVNLELTYYRKKTEDALISRQLAPSLGVAAARFENLGSVLNEGFEAAVDARVLTLSNVQWDLRVSGSHNKNELLELGEGVSPILILSGRQRHIEGYPLGGYWGRRMSFSDANDDGIITPNEITRETDAEFLGNVFPANQMSVSSSLTLFSRLRVGVLFDHAGDYLNYWIGEQVRCQNLICRGLNDPSAPLFDQARAVNAISDPDAAHTPYMEDASFWKLRELSFTLLAPQRWARAIGAENLNLVVTGRNLKTWTDYSGFDPEVSGLGQQAFLQIEEFTIPPVRAWTARVNVGF